MLPLEKLEVFKNTSFLSKIDLIAVVLGTGSSKIGVMELSKSVVEYLSSLKSAPSVEDLMRINGLGRVKSSKILACIEFSNRFMFEYQNNRIETPFDAIPHLNFMKSLEKEEFVAISLDSDNFPLKIHRLTSGLVNQTPIHPREAFRNVIKDNGTSVMFAHNHPSGNLNASIADVNVTERLVKAGNLLGIPVLDHLIICKTGFVSIKQKHPLCFT